MDVATESDGNWSASAPEAIVRRNTAEKLLNISSTVEFRSCGKFDTVGMAVADDVDEFSNNGTGLWKNFEDDESVKGVEMIGVEDAVENEVVEKWETIGPSFANEDLVSQPAGVRSKLSCLMRSAAYKMSEATMRNLEGGHTPFQQLHTLALADEQQEQGA
jgi:hypothetical protein